MVISCKARSISYIHNDVQSPKWNDSGIHNGSFQKYIGGHNRQLRFVGNDMLSIPRTKTCYYDQSFTVDGVKQWNELPMNIKHSPSLLSFENSIKAYLLLSLTQQYPY